MANYFCTDSVEEQVDYLTDKVKDLNTKKLDKASIVQETGTGTDVVMSQKAVTDVINESLQTINTEINGKLTKPATPTAESAVTMLADGTVGTKLLSEIGGGKSYLHNIRINAQFTYNDNASGDFLFSFTSSRQTEYKLRDLTTIFNAFGSNIITTATIRKQETGGMPNNGIANVLYSEGADVLEIRAFINDSDTVTGYYESGSLSNITSLQDTVTEL